MKKKLTLLFALLCVSVMGFATTYCHTEINSTNGNGSVYMTCSPTANENEYKILFEGTNSHPLKAINAVSVGINDINGVPGGSTLTFDFDAAENGSAVATFTCTSTPNAPYVAYIVFKMSDNSELVLNEFPKDMDWTAVCGGSSKPSPELSLNATSKTLEKDDVAETFQIVPTKTDGSGAISYSSNAEGVATVSNTGLVTAVGPGTATITVSVAENDDFAADSKTLTVEVIDWTSIAWLTNSNDSYKLYISPAMGGDGQRIEGSNLWVGFPSAEFGDMSIVPSGGEGAWRTFALSNFPGYRNQFTVVCQGTTYTFTIYRKFEGVNLAKGMPSTAGRDASNAWQSNDGNKESRWGSAGAKHYAAVGDAAEDWWYVDLGAFYAINQVKILFETACPHDFDILTSPNGTSWVERGTYGEPAHKGKTDADYNEYSFSPAPNARYVKVFARSGYESLAYGFSMWDLEVYGQPAENVDVNAPVLASAAVSGTPTTTEIKIAVSASDTEDDAISLFHVVEPTLGYDRNMTAADGKLTFSGLVDGTDYSFTITALDNIGNQSNAIVVNASTAVDPSNPATMAPEPPVRSADDVRAIYSDAYADILMHDFMPGTQWGAAAAERRVKSGNNYLLYDISSNNNITWGMNDGGANAIVANDGYHAVGTTGLDASGMEYLHVDIWSLVALTNVNVKINDAVFTTITHDGGGWQSYDLEMTGSAVDFTNIRWLKLDGITSSETRGKAAVDNYYFWKAPSGVKAVVVSSNNGSWGSATAKVADEDVTSVPTGTEVTFAAAAETGYDFAYWQIGETKVYDNPYMVEVDANITAVATFEPSRTPYCAVPVTNAQGHTIYLTINKTENANEFRILFEGSSNTHITNTHGNIQFRLTHVNGEDGEHHFAGNEWTVDAAGYGSIYTTFTAADFRAITITNTYIPLTTSNSAADEFNFPTTDATIIKWDATCTDAEAPVLGTPVATPLSGTSVRLALSATDNMAALLTYTISYEGLATPIEVPGASGETTYYNVKGLSAGTSYTFFVTVSDGTNVSAAQSCSATPSMPTAPVPAHEAVAVRSVYSDTYESALAHDFQKDSWHGYDLTYTELNIAGDHNLLYDLVPYNQDAWFSWGAIDGANAIVAKDGFNDGEHDGLDASGMDHMHIDIWSVNVAPYAEVQIMDSKLADIPLAGTGWQSFDLPLAAFKAAHPDKIADINHMKFVGFRGPNNPEQIAIDNVYFWKEPDITRDDSWMAPGELGTICIPQGAVATGGDIYELLGKDENGKIVFATVTNNEMTPGKPYLFEAKSNAMRFYYTSATPASEADNSGAMKGTFDGEILTELENVYYFNGHALWSSTNLTQLNVPANRAWVVIDEYMPPVNTSAPLPGRRIMTMNVNGKNTPTAIDQVNSSDAVRKVILNGTLYILRGEKLYDATGRLVK